MTWQSFDTILIEVFSYALEQDLKTSFASAKAAIKFCLVSQLEWAFPFFSRKKINSTWCCNKIAHERRHVAWWQFETWSIPHLKSRRHSNYRWIGISIFRQPREHTFTPIVWSHLPLLLPSWWRTHEEEKEKQQIFFVWACPEQPKKESRNVWSNINSMYINTRGMQLSICSCSAMCAASISFLSLLFFDYSSAQTMRVSDCVHN